MVDGHGVANGPEVHVEDCLQAVTATRGRCEADPAAVRGYTHAPLEADGGEVMAFVDDDQAGACEYRSGVGVSGQGLEGRYCCSAIVEAPHTVGNPGGKRLHRHGTCRHFRDRLVRLRRRS